MTTRKEIIIKPRTAFSLDLREIWDYRELLYIFTWRDIKVRYKQTLLGLVWVLFQPVVTATIFSIFFGKLAKIPSGTLPYPLFVFVGLAIWTFFSNALSSASVSLIGYEGMIKKVYFPKILIPLSAILTALFDFLVTLVFVFIASLYFGFVPRVEAIWIFPLLTLILLFCLIGASLFTSALNVKYRDVRFALPFFIQIGLFVSPVIFPIAVIFDFRKWFLYLNPLTGIIETTRTLISGAAVDWNLIGLSAAVSLALAIFGIYYFGKTESYFADIA